MLFDGIKLVEGSEIQSLIVNAGTTFPGSPINGELFFISGTGGGEIVGLYMYYSSLTEWVRQVDENDVITITGDATGSGTSSIALTLANTAVTANPYGSASGVATFTVDSKGRLTAAASVPIAIATSQVTSGTFADARVAQTNVTQHQASLTIAETQITDGALLARLAANESVTGNWTFNNPVIGATPTLGTHLTTKTYVDNVAAGMNVHLAVRAASTVNLTATYLNGTSGVGATLTGTGVLPAFDGITLNVADRVLIKDQVDQTTNGIYVVTQTTANWVITRAADFDNSPTGEVTAGASTFIQSGTQATTQWVQTSLSAVVGTDNIIFTQFGGPGTYTGGTGITISGTTISINTSYVGQTSITTLGTIATGTWNATTVAANRGGTGQSVYVIGDLLYASTTTALSKLAAGTLGNLLTSNGPGVAPSWAAPPVTILGGNPTANVGLTAVNGVATTYMRSDGAPALNQAITPTWSALHTFSGGLVISSTITLNSTTGASGQVLTSNGASAPTWQDASGGTDNLTSITVSSGTTNLNLALGNVFHLTMNLSTTITFSNPPVAGKSQTITIFILQDGVGSKTITWPAAVKWSDGLAPVLTTTAGRLDAVTVTTINSGTSYYGGQVMANITP